MSLTLSDLPAEVRELIAPHMETPPSLEQIGIQIAMKRDEAKAARSASGIEAVWSEAEEAYIGIDDANRHEFTDMRWAKPMSPDGPVTTDRSTAAPGHRSTAFLRLTARYTDAGAAKLQEILLPADDKAFNFKAMPVPAVIDAKEDDRQVVHEHLGALMRPPHPGEMPPGQPPQPVPLTVKDLAKERIELATKQAKAAETRIYDWMIASQYRPEFRKVIKDSAKLGTGVLKGPFPKSKRAAAMRKTDDGVDIFIRDKIVPSCERKSVWNLFPDPACGEDIHNGDYVFERDHMSTRQVRELKKIDGYIKDKIDQVLAEGPDKSNLDEDSGVQRRHGQKTKTRYTIWYFYGVLTKDEMTAIDVASGVVKPYESEEVYAIVTMINDSVIRASINPLDSGSFPYSVMPWQERDGHWAGIGVPEQMKTPQRVTNAALRAMLNNAGKAADNQYIIDQMAIIPADGDWVITPGKIWLTTNDFQGDIRQAFMVVTIPNTTQMLQSIIEMGARFAEETTSIPLISQGQSGKTTPDTYGATQLQDSNANQLLRSIGYAFDDFITEPVVRRYYEWLLMDPDVPEEEKGEFQIDAHGSIALVERAIQDQTIAQMGPLSKDPDYRISPKKWAVQFLRSHKLDPGDFQYDEADQEKLDKAPAPVAPAVQVAQINADTQIKIGEMKLTADQQSAQSTERIETAAQTLEGQRIQTDQHEIVVNAGVKLHELEMAHQRALLEYANRYRISVDQAKTQLADTSMKLQVEQELNAVNNAVDVHKHTVDKAVDLHKFHNPQPKPAVQVPGRARNGQSASQAGP